MPYTMNNALRAAAFTVATLFLSAPAGAAAPLSMALDDLRLEQNGSGVREILWIGVYEAAFYLPGNRLAESRRDETFSLNGDTSAAFRIELLISQVPSIPDEWRVIFERYLTDDQLGNLEAAYDRLGKGDTVVFHFRPGNGTVVEISTGSKTRVDGHGLMADLLLQWLGPDPVSRDLRADLMGRPQVENAGASAWNGERRR